MSTAFGPPIPLIQKDLDTISQYKTSLILPRFTAEDAWTIGSSLRTRLLNHPKAVVISICLANNQQVIFQAINHTGTAPDNSIWISRKVKTVLRFGVPSFFMHVKFSADEDAFAAKYGMSSAQTSEYAIHGGAVPVFVKGVEGVVAVVTVSGLSQEEDHGAVIEALSNFKKSIAG